MFISSDLSLAGSWMRGVSSPRTGGSRDGPAARTEKDGGRASSSGHSCRRCLSGRQMTVDGPPGIGSPSRRPSGRSVMTGGGTGGLVADRCGVHDGHLCGDVGCASRGGGYVNGGGGFVTGVNLCACLIRHPWLPTVHGEGFLGVCRSSVGVR